MSYNQKGRIIIQFLFKILYDKPENLPQKIRDYLKDEERHVVVKDYISGMTDNFADALYEKLK